MDPDGAGLSIQQLLQAHHGLPSEADLPAWRPIPVEAPKSQDRPAPAEVPVALVRLYVQCDRVPLALSRLRF